MLCTSPAARERMREICFVKTPQIIFNDVCACPSILTTDCCNCQEWLNDITWQTPQVGAPVRQLHLRDLLLPAAQIDPVLHNLKLVVRSNCLFEPFINENEHFTKTGSGQT
jgi:hypothetical protein